MDSSAILLALVFLAPAFVLPLILGPILLGSTSGDPLGKMAGMFTMKPLLATPLWLLILASEPGTVLATLFLSMTPGIGLTLLILYVCRRVLKTEKKTSLLLVSADCVRWLFSAFYLWLPSKPAAPNLGNPWYLVGMALPNAYALMAFLILWLRRRHSEA